MSGGGCRGGGGGGVREPVKIVVISTQYVETDKTSFKSVVQKLTGKNSGIVGNYDNNTIVPTKSRKVRPYSGMKMEERTIPQSAAPSAAAAGINEMGRSNSILTKDLPFMEFDRLLKEMPPVDELYNGLWVD